MNKNYIILGVAVIVIIAAGIGAYFYMSEEPVPDFTVNGKEVEVNDTYDVSSADEVIGITGSNFTIPEGFEGNLSYQSTSPKADLKNEDNYLTIMSIGQDKVEDMANQFVENNKGLSIGEVQKFTNTDGDNITIVEINQGSDVVSHMYYVQINDNVYDINMYGIELKDLINMNK